MKKNLIYEKSIILILILIVIFLYYIEVYNTNFVAIALIIIDIYSIIKYRKNVLIFFAFLCMFYFDYSFIISKYLMSTPNLEQVYSQIRYSNTLYIGIASVFLFHAIILLILRKGNVFEKDMDKSFFNPKNKNTFIIIILTILITIILIDYLFLNFLSLSRTIYEYLLILFVLAFYYSKNNKFFRKILFILMMISTIVNTIAGGRIISLQPMIAYFIINYFEKINSKKIFIVILVGVVLFTIFGLYGDFIDYGYDLKELNYLTIINTFKDRKLALDTSISAYWTGLTYVEISNIVPFFERIKNFIQYITIYTLGGTSTNYMQLYTISRDYYVHYYGGYITHYFYYWLGWSGIVVISILVGSVINQINNMKYDMSEFKKIYIVYFISSLPRWYLYYPTALIRGTLILFLVYKFLQLITEKNKEEIK